LNWAALISGKYEMSAPRRKEKSSGVMIVGSVVDFLQDTVNKKKIENRKKYFLIHWMNRMRKLGII